jgi:hypothetical protein
MESVREVKRKCKGKESRYGKRYGFRLKLRCMKLRLEEGLPVSLLSKVVGGSTAAEVEENLSHERVGLRIFLPNF